MSALPHHHCEAPARGRRHDRWGVVACTAAGLMVLALASFKLSSVDLGYHVAYGRVFLSTGRIVDRDPFLYPEHAQDFINANWGAQVVMAAAERVAGAGGLTALRIVLIAVTFACIGATVHRSTGSLTWTAAAWIAAGLGTYERFSMRPELFSYAAMAAIVMLPARGLDTWRRVGLVVVLQLLWVNLHSYFLIGPMLTGCWAIAAAAGWLRRRADAERRAMFRRLGIAFGLQVGACLVNPWGYPGARFPIDTLSQMRASGSFGGGTESAAESSWAAISEFHSPFAYAGQRVCGGTIRAYWALIALTVLGVLAAVAGGRWPIMLALVLLFAMSTQMRRNIALLALAGTPLAIGAIAPLVAALAAPDRKRTWLRALIPLGLAAAAIWATVAVARGQFYFAERRVSREFGFGYSERTFPREAAACLARHPELKPNLYADYFASSNLLPWLPERFKLFVDTNTFAYSPATLAAAQKVERGITSHEEFSEKHGVNVVLLSANANSLPLIRALAADYTSWELIHLDRHYVVFIRRLPEHVPVLRLYNLTPDSLPVQEWIESIRGPAAARAMELYLSAAGPMAIGAYRPAAALLKEATAAKPEFSEAWKQLGIYHLNTGKAAARGGDWSAASEAWRQAVDCFDQAVRLDAEDKEALELLRSTRDALEVIRE